MNKIEILYNNNWVDITGVTEEVGRIPYNGRNRDYTLRLARVKLKIAVTIRNLLNDENFYPSEATPIRFYENSTFIYGGYIVKNLYNFADMTFSVEVQNNLGYLQSVLVEYDKLHHLFVTGINWYDYCTSDIEGNPIVGVLWAMKKMFQAANLSLDTSSLENEEVVNYSGEIYIRNCTIDFKDFFFYEKMLWCAGQSVCADHSVIDNPDHDYNRDKKNAFDIVSEICSSLRLSIKQISVDSYSLVYSSEDTYNVADDDNFDYTTEKIKAKTNNYQDNLSWPSVYNPLSDYSRTESQIEQIRQSGIDLRTNGRGMPVEVITNFTIFYSDAKLNETPGYTGIHNDIACSGAITPSFIHTIIDLQYGETTVDWKHVNSIAMKVRETAINFTEENITTNFISENKNVVEHNVDLGWSNSEITQEAYSE